MEDSTLDKGLRRFGAEDGIKIATLGLQHQFRTGKGELAQICDFCRDRKAIVFVELDDHPGAMELINDPNIPPREKVVAFNKLNLLGKAREYKPFQKVYNGELDLFGIVDSVLHANPDAAIIPIDLPSHGGFKLCVSMLKDLFKDNFNRSLSTFVDNPSDSKAAEFMAWHHMFFLISQYDHMRLREPYMLEKMERAIRENDDAVFALVAGIWHIPHLIGPLAERLPQLRSFGINVENEMSSEDIYTIENPLMGFVPPGEIEEFAGMISGAVGAFLNGGMSVESVARMMDYSASELRPRGFELQQRIKQRVIESKDDKDIVFNLLRYNVSRIMSRSMHEAIADHEGELPEAYSPSDRELYAKASRRLAEFWPDFHVSLKDAVRIYAQTLSGCRDDASPLEVVDAFAEIYKKTAKTHSKRVKLG